MMRTTLVFLALVLALVVKASQAVVATPPSTPPDAACTWEQVTEAIAFNADLPRAAIVTDVSPPPQSAPTCTLGLAKYIFAAHQRYEERQRLQVVDATAQAGACVPDKNVACLFNGRFEIAITFADASMAPGQYGVAQTLQPLLAVDGTPVNGAVFWFYSSSIPEALGKIVKGCALGGHWWVFFAANTNVAYSAQFVDTTTWSGVAVGNPLNQLALPWANTSAFQCSAADMSSSTYLKQHGILVLGDISTPGTPLDEVSIFTVRADGTSKKMLTGPGNQYPSWTPDGKIIFVSNRSGSPQVWIMDEDGTNPRQIGNLNLNGQITRVQTAKNGLIAFLHSGDGIWLMQKDGSGLRELVKFENGAGDAPSLALSGTWLSYTAPADSTPGHNEIFRINTDGTGLKQLTFPTDPDYPDGNASSISPDETMIAIYTGVESHANDPGFTEHHNIALIGPNGGTRSLLTTCQPAMPMPNVSPDKCITSDNPSWSPDGQWIIYDRGSFNPDGSGTWAIDVNGNNIQRLNRAFAGGGSAPLKFTE